MNDRPDMGRRVQLLLVDDCVAERNFYELTLAPDFKVITASRGDQGLAIARRERPQAIVLDVIMSFSCGLVFSYTAYRQAELLLESG